MISRKIVCSLLCISTLSHTMDTLETAPLYIVAGSIRTTTLKNSFPQETLWSESKANLSHTGTYKGKATTIDIRQCDIPDTRNIKANVRTHDFGTNVIKAAYLERLPTFDDTTTKNGDILVASLTNTLGESIQNIGKNMKTKAKMEIEWHPYIIFPRKSMDTVKSIVDKQYTKDNPFTAAINIGLATASIQMACGKPIPDDIECPKEFVACAEQLSTTLTNLIAFYSQNGLGSVEQLKKRILQEFWLWDHLDETNMLAALSHGPAASLEQFSQAIQKFVLADKSISQWERLVIRQSGLRLYDTNDILTDSLFAFMFCDAAIIHGQKYVKKFMANNGFKDITLERKTSKRNGRTNVWILEATKI